MRVDQLTRDFISGWIMENNSARQAPFDLSVNGVVVASRLIADIYRGDLATHFGNHGRFGFCIQFDTQSGDEPLQIEFRDSQTGALISQLTQEAQKYAGHLDTYSKGHLVGWCYDSAASTPMLVDIYLDDKLLQRRFSADLMRKDLVLPEESRRAGFSIPLTGLVGKVTETSQVQVLNHSTGELICRRLAQELFPESYFTLDQDVKEGQHVMEENLDGDWSAIQNTFDAYFYLKKYDIKMGMDPIKHYLKEGWGKGYNPAPWFSTSFYLRANPDVVEAGVNPFVHYCKEGFREGRLPEQESGAISFLLAPWSDQSQHLLLTGCTLKGNDLYVEGYVRHPQYPGLPVRIEIGLEGQDPILILTRGDTPYQYGTPPFNLGEHFLFNCKFRVDQDTTDLKLCCAIADTDILYKMKLQAITEVTTENVYPEPQKNWTVIGSVDGVSANGIAGWALYEQSPQTPLTLVLSIGGVPVASVVCRIHRKGLPLKFEGSSYAGFVFDVPPEVTSQLEHTSFTIAPAVGVNKIRRNVGDIPPKGLVAFDPPQKVSRMALPMPEVSVDEPVSAIVLNLNGATILDDLLQTAYDHEENEKIEWIIIDHGSQDESEDIAQLASARGQRVQFIHRSGNLSFSDSNNYGARLAKHDVLMFVNNDLIFRAPFRQKVLDALALSDVGTVGALLYDYLPQAAGEIEAPVQHAGVCFAQRIERRWIRPFELRPIPGQMDEIGSVLDAPVVTGAFMAMRRADFEAVGGFTEDYFYGLEDVDLCLKVRADLKKRVVCDARLDIVHHRGFSRHGETDVTVRQRNNNNIFNRTWALSLRKSIRNQVATNPAYWSGSTPVVAFIVADAGDNTNAGEYFTALELGHALQKTFPCQLRFLIEPEWMDLEGIDIVIAMVSHFDILKAKKVNPYLIAINWTRQWFDRWAENEGMFAYDAVYASSQRAADFLSKKTTLDVLVLPIATNFEKFATAEPIEELRADYCFTGNYVGTKREIMYQLNPDEINAKGVVYGSGWEGSPFESICYGPIAYSKMPNVYASTKIVIDDANIATKDWGSCNSRVFDAIAGGCLLITNGPKGVQELFGDAVPTFDSAVSLKETIEYWLDHEDERQERVRHLQNIVRAKHTYTHRGDTVGEFLSAGNLKPKIAIKCAAIWDERESWGDYHFAHSIAKELRKLGFTVRVDCRENWYNGIAATDDVNLVLRGLKSFEPPAHQLNILWLISHPADIPVSEINRYDYVYTASHIHKELLTEIVDVPVEALLQCTDGERFHYNVVDDSDRNTEKALFVGNSRGIFRHAVRWSVETEKDIDLYGKGWEQFVKDQRLKGQFISNVRLPEYYGKAKVVLCDHWADMSRCGYLSNRAFDALACGSWLAVDEVAGMEDILPGGYSIFRTKEELQKILETPKFGNEAERRKLAKWVAENHTFRNRAEVLGKQIQFLLPAEIDTTSFLSERRNDT